MGVQWKDGTNSWVPLREMKESHKIQTAEYAEANELLDEPAFLWWDPFTLNKKDRMIPKVKSRMNKITHKYGLVVPRNVAHTYELDKRNKNTFWADAIKK